MSTHLQKGFVHLFMLLLLVAGIGSGLYLVQNPAIFTPKASEGETVLADQSQSPALVFVFTSESNSGGIACNCYATQEELSETSAVKILNNNTYAFENLRIGFNSLIDHDKFSLPPFSSNGTVRGTAHGFELQLANEVKEHKFPGNDQVYLVKTGQGGSRISQWNIGGTYWMKFLNRINSAKILLGSRPIQWVVWYSLGVNDHIDGTPVASFKTGTLAHVNKIKAELPGAIVVMTQFQDLGAKDFRDYNAALAEIANTEPNVYVVDTTIPPHPPYANGAADLTGDKYHWEYNSMKLIVSRMINITKAALKIGASSSMTAYPNPCTLSAGGSCSSILRWYYPDVNNFKIAIKENPGIVLSSKSIGMQDISWITQNGATFEAYSGVNLLGSLHVKGVPPSPSPSPSPKLISSNISATPCTLAPGQSRCTSKITWSTANATGPVKITIKETGGLFAQAPSGSQDFPWVSKIPLTMQLMEGNNPTPLKTLVVQSAPILTASPNPCTLTAAGRCTVKLTWNNSNYSNFDIYIKENNLVFYKGPSGSVDVDFITSKGATFQARSNGQVIDSLFVKGTSTGL